MDRLDVPPLAEADLERRFGGLRRLWGDAGYQRVRAARLAVIGVGGVGSWAAEALARCGVARLVLVDLDHVAESNINRQVQADSATLGAAKVAALAARIALIHPDCEVRAVEAFVEEGHWPGLLGAPAAEVVDGVIDACDDARAKLLLARWALRSRLPLVVAGAAGGKEHAARTAVADLADVTHDPLLAALRQRLRKAGEAPARGAIGLRCVYSAEPVRRPEAACDSAAAAPEGNLNCHGYGSSVMVTASFGLAAADEALRLLRQAGPANTLSA